MSFELQQRQVQSQSQVLSQRQIQSLELLSLAEQDLWQAADKEAQENPALIVSDTVHKAVGQMDFTRISRNFTVNEDASENFLAALEAQPDNRRTLQQHLLTQLNMHRLSSAEYSLAKRLIFNLDEKGFHILAPVSLLKKDSGTPSQKLLNKCLALVQSFDPSGICVANTEESLSLQARQRGDAPAMALFILDGRLSFLDPPKPEKIAKKISSYIKKQNALFANDSGQELKNFEASEKAAAEALEFIRTLDPMPARNFSETAPNFVTPDIYVERLGKDEELPEGEDAEFGGTRWRIRLANDVASLLSLNPQLSKAAAKRGCDKEIVNSVRKAREFIDAVSFRQSTVLKACRLLVALQGEFFLKGPGHLVPLRQKDIADKLKVHETTISRMANSKFIQCEWGLFGIKYFFNNAASSDGASRDNVLHEIRRIISETAGSKLSDQKISDILAQSGMKIARRTVAKYRSQLNIDSSYNR